jgi:ABC-type multidrug transport system fused ATPase/permease subunit
MLKLYLNKLFSLLTSFEKKNLIILLFLMIIGSFMEIVGIGALPAFIALIAKPEILQNSPFAVNLLNTLHIKGQIDLLIWGAATLIIIFIIKNTYLSILGYYKSKVVFGIQLRMSHDLFKEYLKAPYTFHLNKNSSELLSNVYDAVKIIITGILMPLVSMLMELLLMISIMILLISVEPLITIVTIGVFSLAGIIYLNLTKKKSAHFGEQLNKLRTIVYKIVTEGLVGFKDARVLNREDYFVKQFHDSSEKNVKGLIHQSFINGLTKPILETVAMCLMLLITISLVIKNDSINNILPSLALFGFASIRLLPSFSQILGSYSSIRYSLSAIDPVWNDLNYLKNKKAEHYKLFNAHSEVRLNSQIELLDISYRYPEAETDSLSKITLTIEAGKAIAFVGSSGAGKTTIVDVLLGLLQPTEGKILVDDTDISVNISDWQKQIGYIPQHIFLADNSVRKNIAFGVDEEEIDDKRVLETLRLAQLENLINELPEGIHTMIGERGIRFSGGQRQRVGIARALYHNPKILIMDEATSALDNITEKNIVEEIESLKGSRTIVIIAHRLTTVQNCDTIYFMEKGKVIDSGTYEELINNNAAFKKMALVD